MNNEHTTPTIIAAVAMIAVIVRFGWSIDTLFLGACFVAFYCLCMAGFYRLYDQMVTVIRAGNKMATDLRELRAENKKLTEDLNRCHEKVAKHYACRM